MEGDVERLVECSGVSLPLAARIVSLVLDSGVTHVELKAAFQIVEALWAILPISYAPDDPELPAPDGEPPV